MNGAGARLRAARVVFGKELLEGIRDRRALIAVLISISILPVMFVLLGRFAREVRDEVAAMTIPVEGREHAPALAEWLERVPGITLEAAPEDPEEAVRSREVDLVLRIPANYGERFAEGRPAELDLIEDSSRTAAGAKASRVNTLLRAYGREVAAMRLISRGVSPLLLEPVEVRRAEVFSERRRTAFSVLGIIPMFLLMNAFFGGMQIAADSVAGERERGSIEALLINAVPGSALVFGKWAAASVFAVFLTATGLVTCMVLFRFLPGASVEPSLADWGRVALTALPLALFCCSLQVVVATYARSFKEAQTYFGYLAFLPMIPFFAVTLNWVEQGSWAAWVPIVGHHLTILTALAGDPVSVAQIAAGFAFSLVGAGALLWFAARLFVRESVVFLR